MYGLIGKMIAKPGKRDELIALMSSDMGAMPGCLSYVVAIDPANSDAMWVTEVWVDKAAHGASLTIPEVKAVIAKAMPLIAGFGEHFETEPVSGIGLATGR